MNPASPGSIYVRGSKAGRPNFPEAKRQGPKLGYNNAPVVQEHDIDLGDRTLRKGHRLIRWYTAPVCVSAIIYVEVDSHCSLVDTAPVAARK